MQTDVPRSALTPFPNLYSHSDLPPRLNTACVELFTECKLPQEFILISWAVLLKAYTGQEALRFLADGETVTVHSADWTIERQQVTFAELHAESTLIRFKQSNDPGTRTEGSKTDDSSRAVRSSSSSSRSTSPTSSDSIATSSLQSSQSSADGIDSTASSLSLVYDFHRGSASLHSSGAAIPPEHRPELGKQFLQAVQWVAKVKCIDQYPKSDYEARLSILNPSPSLANGPQLLHDLVNREVRGSLAAIEFLQPDGQTSKMSYDELHRLPFA